MATRNTRPLTHIHSIQKHGTKHKHDIEISFITILILSLPPTHPHTHTNLPSRASHTRTDPSADALTNSHTPPPEAEDAADVIGVMKQRAVTGAEWPRRRKRGVADFRRGSACALSSPERRSSEKEEEEEGVVCVSDQRQMGPRREPVAAQWLSAERATDRILWSGTASGCQRMYGSTRLDESIFLSFFLSLSLGLSVSRSLGPSVSLSLCLFVF